MGDWSGVFAEIEAALASEIARRRTATPGEDGHA
jgi:hypothetical protein